MNEEACYELDVQQHIQMALDENARRLKVWDDFKAAWLTMAAIARAEKKPEPEKILPGWKISVTATPFTIGQPYEITDHSGPDRVADGTLELAPIPSFGQDQYPPDVTAFGMDWGNVIAGLPNDTRPDGFLTDYTRANGEVVRVRKVYHKRGTYGALFSDHNFYEVVK